MPSDSPPDQRLPVLGADNESLVEWLTLLGLRTEQLNEARPPALAKVVAELTTATEELRATEAEMRAQAAELASAESRLEAARRHYQELFDFAPDAYVVTDAQGVIREANQATSALVGSARTYVIGKPLAALLDRDSVVAFTARLQAFQQVADDRPQTWQMELRSRRAAPPTRVSIHVGRIVDATGAVTGYRWLLRDVTELQATTTALERLQATHAQQLRTRTMELEAVLRMKDEVAALDRGALRALVHDAVRALQHGAEPGVTLATVLTSLQAHLDGPAATAAAG